MEKRRGGLAGLALSLSLVPTHISAVTVLYDALSLDYRVSINPGTALVSTGTGKD